jgi:hypothetical protein
MLPEADYAVYFVLDDDIIECTACDPEAGEPSDWPSWCDQDRWTHIDEPDQVSLDDVAWLNSNPLPLPLPAPIAGGSPGPFEPSDQDWEDYARWSGHTTDADIAAAGLAVG